MPFKEWIEWNFKRVEESGLSSSDELSKNWLSAYAESLAQKRREIAPH